RRRPSVGAVASWITQVRVSRRQRTVDAEGAGQELHQPGRRRHSGDVADQGAVSRSGDQDTGYVSLQSVETQGMVVAARGAWHANESRSAVRGVGRAAGASPEGKGSDDRRGAPATRLEGAAVDPIPRACARC